MNTSKNIIFFISIILISNYMFATEYHVAKNGKDTNTGTESHPFNTISEAVKHAYPGDVITVHEGTYREWVNPTRGGESENKRIVYRAATGEKVEIKGSEVVANWQKVKGTVWKVVIPNSFFKDYNPYKDSINGDWFTNKGRIHHTGEVFLNGKSLYEKESIEKVFNPVLDESKQDVEGATYTWYCESDNHNTTIWANFQKFKPNKELVEISARETVFYSKEPGINYITISGFHISQAATQWGAPTAEQVGMIGTHWNKGWIIENNVISDSKCSGITLGKERSTGHNVWSIDRSISGSNHYIEVTFNALRHGWNKNNIGSHIVRNNTIFNCEQTGICGSMGAAFSTIENNHIYNIWTKRQFDGAEIGGIKFHAPIDAVIKNNRIHNTGRGIWLDWMTQGSRVSGNLLYDNTREDLFLEVNHGPFVVDNNIFLSPASLRIQSQGGAYVNNLIAGGVFRWSEGGRYTPYHEAHSTEITGLSNVFTGDDRYYNNVFVGAKKANSGRQKSYKPGLVDYKKTKFPIFLNGNVYYNGILAHNQDEDFIELTTYNPQLELIVDNEAVYLKLSFSEEFYKHHGKIITTDILGKAKIPNARFDNPDGTPLTIDKDYFGNSRLNGVNNAGPFNDLKQGLNKIKVW